MEQNTLKNIVIIYHAQCRDGFGAAYAAWKKFGDSASYIPRKTQEKVPEGIVNKEVYIVDYSYSKEELIGLCANNTSVVVIDHHQTSKEAVEAFPENVFDIGHSGAVLAWQYFHPDTEVPKLLLYIEDHDLWKFALPDTRAFGAALAEYDMEFAVWDTLITDMEDANYFSSFIVLGNTIARFEDRLVQNILQYKEKVLFEGQEMYALNCSRVYRSILGHKLATLNSQEDGPAIGIVYYRSNGSVNCSLRSNGDTDVRIIAEKYGGGGHKNAASFKVDSFAKLPFTFV